MDKTLEQLQSNFSELIANATETDRTVVKLVMKNSYLSKRICQYEKEMKTKTTEIAELKLLLSKEKNSAIQKSVVEKMEKENQELYKKIQSLTTQLKEANDRVLKLASELLSEELQTFELNKDKIQLEENLKEATDRALELANELQSEELENFEANEAKIKLEQQLKEEYDRHNTIMDEYQKIVEEEITKLKMEKAELKKIIEDQNKIITRSKAKHSKATVHIKNLKSEMKSKDVEHRNILSMKDQMIQKLSDRIAELEEENNRLHQNSNEFYNFDNDFDALDIEEPDEQPVQSSDDDDEGIEYDIETNDGIRLAKYIRPQPINVNESDTYVITEYFGYQKTSTATQLIVFDWKDPSKCYRYGTYANAQSFCLGCSKAKNGKSTLKIFDDENGKKFVQMKRNHCCKPEEYKEFSIERKTNFEIHSTAAGQKELVIFTSAEKSQCHRYHEFAHERFSCTFCTHGGKYVTAKFYENENYVKVDSNHECEPSEYFESIKKPNFVTSEMKGNQIYPFYIIFVEKENVIDQTKCHVFVKKDNRYKCREKSCRITARIWEKDGNEYVQVYGRHVCKPCQVLKDENGKEYVKLPRNKRSYIMSEN